MPPATRRVMKTFIDANGNPSFEHTEVIQKQALVPLIQATLAQPYAPKPHDSEEDKIRFSGLTNVEVGAIRYAEGFASGDPKYIEATLDRLIGKPRQEVHNINTNVSVQEFLAGIPDSVHVLLPEHRFTRIEDQTTHQAQIMDIAVVETNPNPNYDV